jgi:hypothetical protein
MYFEGMEFVLRRGVVPLENVESCADRNPETRHGASAATSVSQAKIAAAVCWKG